MSRNIARNYIAKNGCNKGIDNQGKGKSYHGMGKGSRSKAKNYQTKGKNYHGTDCNSVFHDARQWRYDFDVAENGTVDANMMVICQMRIQIYRQTLAAIRAALWTTPMGHAVHLNLTQPALTARIDYTEIIRDSRLVSEQRSGCILQNVEVLNVDMLDYAGQLVEQQQSVAVLNMASARHAGGGVARGAGAQEENMHRRSDAVRFTVEQREQHYPIHGSVCLISKGVTIFRGSEKEGYPFLAKPFKVTMLTCAAVNVTKEKDPLPLMEDKISSIVQAAVATRCNRLVLSAFFANAQSNREVEVSPSI